MKDDLLKRFAELSCGKLMDIGIIVGALHSNNDGVTYTGDAVIRVPHGPVKFTFVAGGLGGQERFDVDRKIFSLPLREAVAFTNGISKGFRVAVFSGMRTGSETYVLEIYLHGGDPNDAKMLQGDYKAVLSFNLSPENFDTSVVVDPMFPFANCVIDDLWALVYNSTDPDLIEVIKVYDPLVTTNNVIINLRKCEWVRTNETWQDYLWEHKIGTSFHQRRGARKGVIGIYDRTSAVHMRNMIEDGAKAVD